MCTVHSHCLRASEQSGSLNAFGCRSPVQLQGGSPALGPVAFVPPVSALDPLAQYITVAETAIEARIAAIRPITSVAFDIPMRLVLAMLIPMPDLHQLND
jgi:hypothetical protein